ncbi:hypothetical protein OFM39_27480, partial [Escherichia coli]|nr:hypothetical protein [Escherichia coli]
TNKQAMIIFTNLDSDFFTRDLPNFIFKVVSLRSVGNRCVHGVFEIIFTFETQMGSHAKTSKVKQKLKVTRNPNPRHTSQTTTQTQQNTS